MISVQQAIDIALDKTERLEVEEVELSQARGAVLAEDVASDIDLPPFEKSMMDGYALRAEDLAEGRKLRVVGTIAAGSYPDFSLGAGEAAKIMTGAPLPTGADSVQMVEKTRTDGEDEVEIMEPVAHGKHVARKSEIMASGSEVVASGSCLSPAVIGVLATVGRSSVKVFRRPEIAILVTGDELVEIDQIPGKGQIRNSNGHTLYHQVVESDAWPVTLGIASDDRGTLRKSIKKGLQSDMLLISGGVSMGEFDLVESVLDEVGANIHYEKVNIKPGKPTVFATYQGKPIFGLPGNPVSASTVFEVIVTPVIKKMSGFELLKQSTIKAILQSDLRSKTRRENFMPAITTVENGKFLTTPVDSKGSADILAYARSNSFIIAASEIDFAEKGQSVNVLLRSDFWKKLLS